MSFALVLLNGEAPSLALVQRFWDNADFRIAADGGANPILALGLKPDLILGDLDSLEKAPAGVEIKKIESQNNTDGEKALDEVSRRGFKKAVLLGALGGRADMHLYNLSLPLKFPHLALTFYTEQERIFLAPKTCLIEGPVGARVSLLPLGEGVEGVTSQGLEWPLIDHTLSVHAFMSISNQIKAPNAQVRHKSGNLLIFVEEI